MNFFDAHLPLKNYNETTTKRCDICESCDIYQLLSAAIADSYGISPFLRSLFSPLPLIWSTQ